MSKYTWHLVEGGARDQLYVGGVPLPIFLEKRIESEWNIYWIVEIDEECGGKTEAFFSEAQAKEWAKEQSKLCLDC